MDRAIEEKWRRAWEKEGIFEADPDESRQKVLVTVPFPYMNGPLHVGHAFTDGRVDVYARFRRMQGLNTLFPWAWHWTGQPLVAAAERLAKGDPAMLKEFVEIEGVAGEEIARFYDPVYMARHYTSEGKESLKSLGLSIDWRREFHTTDLEPSFSKFVTWQMDKLKEKGYVTRGTHPVVWCPRDQSPTGDHDRLEGEGVTWEKFVLVLFPLVGDSGRILPAATLRPETIFGATNLWVNPEVTYFEVRVNDDKECHWVISSPSVEKLREQLKKVEVIKSFSGKDLIGARVRHPLERDRELPVLPGSFVDPDNGTGVVYSVPAHAPADYVALRDLKNDPRSIEKFGLSKTIIEAIEPISLIDIAGSGEYPAVEIVEKMGIRDQKDPLVSRATTEIYRKEFHQGVLNRRTGRFQGMRVADAKPEVVALLEREGMSDYLYELPERVVCRCTTECIVKILEDQWFLKYSDPAWKKLAHECINSISVFPESARQWFHDVIDWYKDWPCARRVGLGTPLPWSPGWIVETLSDSTVYMAFYTIVSTIRERKVPAESLTRSLLDYVLLSEGNIETVLKESGLDSGTVEEMRRQFRYWYPVNLRNSAKELIPNHLTFFVFQHAALFPRDLWPTGISANGMLTHDGAKMSKSKGNVVTLRKALDTFGADVVRAAVLGGSEGLEDVDWREKDVADMKAKLDSLSSFMLGISSAKVIAEENGGADPVRNENASLYVTSRKSTPSQGENGVDIWLQSQIQRRIMRTTHSLEEMKTKTAFHEAFYNYWNDVRYYLKRTDTPSAEALTSAVDVWIRLLSPFIPFTSEELNFRMGQSGFVSVSEFPRAEPSKINPLSELNESVLQNLIEDANSIKKLLKSPPKQLYVFVAPAWSYELMRMVIESRKKEEGGAKISNLLEQAFARLPAVPKSEVAGLVPKMIKTLNQLGEQFLDAYLKVKDDLMEDTVYRRASSYLQRELGVKVHVQGASDSGRYDPKQKARFAIPFKPALYFE